MGDLATGAVESQRAREQHFSGKGIFHSPVTKSPRASILTLVHLCEVVSSEFGETPCPRNNFCGVEILKSLTPQKTGNYIYESKKIVKKIFN